MRCRSGHTRVTYKPYANLQPHSLIDHRHYYGDGLNQGGIEIIDYHFKAGIVHSQGLAEGAGLSH